MGSGTGGSVCPCTTPGVRLVVMLITCENTCCSCPWLCWQFDDEDNVYEMMDDDEYRELVKKRRQREDFVVDDGGSRLPLFLND